MTYFRKVVDKLKYPMVDSTALLVASHPIFTAFETMVSGMSDDVSINTRLYITGLTYAGLGWGIGKVRDFSKSLFKITDETKEGIQQIHDSVYMAAVNLPLGFGIYTLAGETDIKKMAIGTGMGIVFGAFMGPWIGYAIDSYRDLTGLEQCERRAYPNFIKNLKPTAKKGLATMLTATSIGAMGVIYSLTPNSDTQAVYQEKLVIEQRINEPVVKQSGENLENLMKELYSDK
jgi:hypothetical protein